MICTVMSLPAERRIFNVDEYRRMGEAGIFSEDDRIELIEGEILRMSPIGSRHAATVKRLHTQFHDLLGKQAIVSVQDPIVLNDFSEPQPDIAIVHARDDFYAQAHPGAADVFLIVEVADTSINYDRELKLPAYARSEIPEVWIVDLPGERLDVHTDPANGVYRSMRSLGRGDTVAPLSFANLSIAVATILG